MKSSSITLCGNLILDIVNEVPSFVESGSNICLKKNNTVGAIGNIVSFISMLDNDTTIDVQGAVGIDRDGRYIIKWLENFKKLNNQNISCHIQELKNHPTSNAYIISDLSSRKRTSIVQWGACTEIKNYSNKNKWFHLLYADTLSNINLLDLEKISKKAIISMDLCLHSHHFQKKSMILKSLEYVDFLIASDMELLSVTGLKNKNKAVKLLGSLCRGWCIMHFPEGSISSNGEDVIDLQVEAIKKDINVLGAGDMFFSSFFTNINGQDINKDNIQAALEHSHKTTGAFLQGENHVNF